MRAQLNTASAKISLSQNLIAKQRQVLRLFYCESHQPLPPRFLPRSNFSATSRRVHSRIREIYTSCISRGGGMMNPLSLIYRHSRNYTRHECAVYLSIFRIAINWRLQRFTMYPVASISWSLSRSNKFPDIPISCGTTSATSIIITERNASLQSRWWPD